MNKVVVEQELFNLPPLHLDQCFDVAHEILFGIKHQKKCRKKKKWLSIMERIDDYILNKEINAMVPNLAVSETMSICFEAIFQRDLIHPKQRNDMMNHENDEPIQPEYDTYCKDIVKKVNRIIISKYEDTLTVPEPSIGSKTAKSALHGAKSGIKHLMSRKAFLGFTSDTDSTGSKDLSFKKKINLDLYKDLLRETTEIQGPMIIYNDGIDEMNLERMRIEAVK